MKASLLALSFLALTLGYETARAGIESHGGDVFEIGKGVTEIFDKIEYQRPFAPEEISEYKLFIDPQLELLARKLPKTGEYLRKVFTDGKPLWYFVKAGLKPVNDEGRTNVEISLGWEKKQLAVNRGDIVQINLDL